MQFTELMRRDWDERARTDAFYYIATWNPAWDVETFSASGEKDYQELVAPALNELGLDPEGKVALEIGCGVGRMTRSFARRFARTFAMDISEEMLRRGQDLSPEVANITWVHGNGSDLSAVESESVEFAFSYIVLQHVPTSDLVLGYVREMLRVLRPGGVFCFQFNSVSSATMNWKGRAIWNVFDRFREPILGMHLETAGARLAALLHLDPLAAGRTWRGAILDVRDVLETIWAAGGSVAGVKG